MLAVKGMTKDTFNHEDFASAVRKRLPWSSCGYTIKPDEPIDDAITAASLDWELTPCKTLVQYPDGSTGEDKTRVAWVKSGTRDVVVRSSPGWKPYQPRDAVRNMKAWCDEGGIPLHTVGALKSDKVVFALGQLPGEFMIGGKKDRSVGFILLTSSNILGTTNRIINLNVRLVCFNGMTSQSEREFYKQNHLSDFDIGRAKEHVLVATEGMKLAAERGDKLAKLRLSTDDVVNKVYLPVVEPKFKAEELTTNEWDTPEARALLPQRIQQILFSYEAAPGAQPGTGWGALNGYTHWADHIAGRSDHTRMFRSWLGDYGRKKNQIERKLLELAE